eukprot:GHVN01065995.1.p1 GENE.GHVN01065995.1~~GHVN01065995.1.p1  ORF type:complete len:500 (-),score=48.62 GHVN01065995.1:2158-3657(-)
MTTPEDEITPPCSTSGAVTSSLPIAMLSMVGMCYGKGRKGMSHLYFSQASSEPSLEFESDVSFSSRTFLSMKSFSSRLLCVGPREKAQLLNDGIENIPENGLGPISIPDRLGAHSDDEDDHFSDARSTAAHSTVSRSESSNSRLSRSFRSRHRGEHQKRRMSGYATPSSDHYRDDFSTVSGYHSPSNDVVNFTLSNFDEKRRMLNSLLDGIGALERKRHLLQLAELLVDAARTCVAQPPTDDLALAFDSQCLKVWKKEFGIGRILVRGEFIAPVSPSEYSAFASSHVYRKTWDTNIDQIQHVEKIAENIDVCYSATRRIATIFPRDTTILRVIRSIEVQNGCEWDEAILSCNCSVEHPAVPERSGKVRADVHIGCYQAEPHVTPFGVWTKVRMLHEVDPKGWIPSSVIKMVATKVFPRAVEAVLKGLMSHHDIKWEKSGSLSATAYATYMLENASLHLEAGSKKSDDVFGDVFQDFGTQSNGLVKETNISGGETVQSSV